MFSQTDSIYPQFSTDKVVVYNWMLAECVTSEHSDSMVFMARGHLETHPLLSNGGSDRGWDVVNAAAKSRELL